MLKCSICEKKLNNVYEIIHKCKCNKTYCKIHKNDHDCDYDYKHNEKNRLKDKLIKITSTKIIKI